MGFNLGGLGGFGGGLGMLGAFGGGGGGGDLRRLLAQMQRQSNLRHTQAQAYGLQGLDTLRSGYDEAIKNVGRTGLASKLNIESAGQKAGTAIQQSYTNRGLSNTTAMGAAQGAASGQTAAALAGVDQAVSAAKAGLLSQRGAALNAGYRGLADMTQNQLGSEMQLGSMAWQNLANQPSEADQLMQLFQTIGGFLPLAFLGGGGAGAGAAATHSYSPIFPGGGY